MGTLRLAIGPNLVVDAIPLRRTPTDLRELLHWSLDVLREQTAACDVALRVQVDDGVPTSISLDRGKIAWALTALVGSALRYVRHGSRTMPGGTITVRATFAPSAREVVLEVEDDGPGITADRLRTLFDEANGMPAAALALCMVRDVVTAHGGQFDIASDTSYPAHGTTVRLTLPAA